MNGKQLVVGREQEYYTKRAGVMNCGRGVFGARGTGTCISLNVTNDRIEGSVDSDCETAGSWPVEKGQAGEARG